MRERVTIIGGSGFIGTHLVSLCQSAGYEVRIVDIRPSTTYPSLWRFGDVRNADQMLAECAGSDVLINLAAEHRDDVRPLGLYYDVNVLGARNVCMAAESLGVKRMIFTSSVAVYGQQQDPPDEGGSHQPINEYGRTKSLAENEYLYWFRKASGRNLAIVRPTVVFGAGNRGNVYTLLSQIASPMFVMIGKGENRKAMAYVENVAAFLRFVMKTEGLIIANYVDSPALSMNELVILARSRLGKGEGVGLRLPRWFGWFAGAAFDMAARVTGVQFPISRIRIDKFCSETVFRAEQALQIGFVPPVALLDGLATMIDIEFSCHPVKRDT